MPNRPDDPIENWQATWDRHLEEREKAEVREGAERKSAASAALQICRSVFAAVKSWLRAG